MNEAQSILTLLLQHLDKLMDATEEGEENTIEVKVSAEMTREEVVQKILEMVGSDKKVNFTHFWSELSETVFSATCQSLKRSRRRKRSPVASCEEVQYEIYI